MATYRPITTERERYVTVWSRWPDEGWVAERDHVLWYAEDVLELSLEEERQTAGRRIYRIFEHGTNPNEQQGAAS